MKLNVIKNTFIKIINLRFIKKIQLNILLKHFERKSEFPPH